MFLASETEPSMIEDQEPSPGHYYWPDLDVDLCQDAILYPERFPLKAKTHLRPQPV